MKDKPIEIQHYEVELDEVLDYYAKGFHGAPTKKIIKNEAYVDVTKGTVIFKLYLTK